MTRTNTIQDSCTTILIGKNASYDGSTMIARTEDSPNGIFEPKKFIVVTPDKQPKHYKSRLSSFEIELNETPVRYTAVPDVNYEKNGIWGEAGINVYNVAMSATETITTNERVLAADQLLDNAGIGEEDILTLVLPYIKSAKEGVLRLGAILEEHGTYESNGVAFSDEDEIWFLETIGGHHWIAKRVPDDHYVTMPNQLGIESLDFDDPDLLYSSDLKDFIVNNHLDLSFDNKINARVALGSHSDADHHYNTPRAWFMQKFFNPSIEQDPMSDTLPWSRKPEHKITIEDVKYVLSSHYQDTPYDPYGTASKAEKTCFRPIGINRTSQTALLQIRPYVKTPLKGIQWIAFGSMPFNTFIPFYTQINDTPEVMKNTTMRVSTNSFYWQNRLIAALADNHFNKNIADFERYQEKTLALGHKNLIDTDKSITNFDNIESLLEHSNQQITDIVINETYDLLDKVLYRASMHMKNGFFRSDN